jgi:hypothetical protein
VINNLVFVFYLCLKITINIVYFLVFMCAREFNCPLILTDRVCEWFKCCVVFKNLFYFWCVR